MPNTAIREARLALGLSQDELARALRDAGWLSCDRRTVQRYESGEVRRPQFATRRALVGVLGLPWQHLGFDDAEDPVTPSRQTQVVPSQEGDDDEVRRRTFALSVAIAGLSGTASAAGEQLRHQLLSSTGSAGVVDEWEAIRDEYGHRMVQLSPSIVVRLLLNDLTHLKPHLTEAVDGAASRTLFGIAAQLTCMTAWTFANLHQQVDAARWWRTSHQLALRSDDPDMRLWVLAQEALMALYLDAVPVQITRARIAAALSSADSLPPSPAVAKLRCAQAQAAGVDGDVKTATVALASVKRTFDDLPEIVRSDRTSFFGWAETRIDYTESFTYAHLGNYPAAATAQERALAGFAPSAVRDPVKVELQRALCLAKDGALVQAEQHALQQLLRLDRAQVDLTISHLTGKVVSALPADRSTDESRHLRELVQPGVDLAR